MPRTLQKIIYILSPVAAALVAGVIQSNVSDNPGNMAVGVVLLMVVFFGVPFVALTGLIISYFSRNSIDAETRSVHAYLFPAIATWILAFSVILT